MAIDVSREELQFLRRSFRRFALPYLIAGIAVAIAAVALGPARAPVEDSDEPAVQGLITEAASLREALGALRDELDAAEKRDAERSGRVDQLAQHVSRLAGDLAGVSPAGGDAELGARLDEAQRRLHALEARVAEAERHRRNALTLESGGSGGEAAPASAGEPVDWSSSPVGR